MSEEDLVNTTEQFSTANTDDKDAEVKETESVNANESNENPSSISDDDANAGEGENGDENISGNGNNDTVEKHVATVVLSHEEASQEIPPARGDEEFEQVPATAELQQMPATVKLDEVPVTAAYVNAENNFHIRGRNDRKWHSFFVELKAHLAITNADPDPRSNPPLEEWIAKQRRQYQNWKDGTKTNLTDERRLLLDSIEFDWDKPKKSRGRTIAHEAEGKFLESVSLLKEYKSVHGHPNVPETYKENPSLGKWVAQMRSYFRKSSLSKERIETMLDIGFDFTPGDKKIPFEKRLEQLREYKQMHGDVRVPRRWAQNPGLGEWLHSQKKMYRKWQNGDKGGMSEERRNILLEVGVDFSLMEPGPRFNLNADGYQPKAKPIPEMKPISTSPNNRISKWDEKYAQLRGFKALHGHTNVPRRSRKIPSQNALGEWVHFQRRQYRNLTNGKTSTLTIPRKKALEQLGFEWQRAGKRNPGRLSAAALVAELEESAAVAAEEEAKTYAKKWKHVPWDERFMQLKEYYRRFGHSNVPQKWAENPSLGTWVNRQRAAFKNWKEDESVQNRITEKVGINEERYQKMLSVQFEFELRPPYKNKKEGGDDDMEESVEDNDINGNKETSKVEEDTAVVSTEDSNWQGKSSTSETAIVPAELNESVQAVLKSLEERNITETKEEETTLMIKSEFSNEAEMLELSSQPEKPKALSIDWEERLLELQQYKLRKGNCNVPRNWKTNPGLSDWVIKQRNQFRLWQEGKPSQITDSRIEKLGKLGFQFVPLDADGNPIVETSNSKATSKLASSKITTVKKRASLGPTTCTPKSRFKEGKWLESLAKVVAYKEKNGNCNIPRKWKENPQLGEWVHFQRRQYRQRRLNKANHMTDERIKMLDEIGFRWGRITGDKDSEIFPSSTVNVTKVEEFVDNNDDAPINDNAEEEKVLKPTNIEEIPDVNGMKVCTTANEGVKEKIENLVVRDDEKKAMQDITAQKESSNSVASIKVKEQISVDGKQVILPVDHVAEESNLNSEVEAEDSGKNVNLGNNLSTELEKKGCNFVKTSTEDNEQTKAEDDNIVSIRNETQTKETSLPSGEDTKDVDMNQNIQNQAAV